MCSAFTIAVHAQYIRLQAALPLEYARTHNAATKIRELSCGAWLVLGTAGSSMVHRLRYDWPKAPRRWSSPMDSPQVLHYSDITNHTFCMHPCEHPSYSFHIVIGFWWVSSLALDGAG